ncbi:hypothetical protein SAMN05216316_0704 [Nitrosovibrio sp. Nv6]|nr:hypothetical protein SAMN05216316_0704 [Nitrosovibrio sp. Nv6]
MLFLAVILSGCASMSSTRQPENLTTFTLNAGYETAFRIVDENLKKCMALDGVSSVIYPDQKRANINIGDGVIAISMDIKENGSDSSIADFYSAFPLMRRYTGIFKGWVNEGKTGCS